MAKRKGAPPIDEEVDTAALRQALLTYDKLRKDNEAALRALMRARLSLGSVPADDRRLDEIDGTCKDAAAKTEAELQNLGSLIAKINAAIDILGRKDAEIRARNASLDDQSRRVKRKSSVLNSIVGRLPVWRGPPDVLPPLVGAIPAEPGYIVPVGEQVAARTSKPKDTESVWILAVVLQYMPDKQKYEVEDIIEDGIDDSDGVKRYVLNANAVVPLPRWMPLPTATQAHHAVGAEVLALYPQTTCFYAGHVGGLPSKERSEYLIRFADDEDVDGSTPDREVAQKFVIAMPKKVKGKP